ncbi:hypothetical protein CLF_102076 [Clonorchis sinensis]|uniref:Uncharacterized protein n=1 Tax=Clonorchis sinensis TaxID=79923 RepID=G7Y786_CLOSI|nr:hypothetical protein CLF_102076 [Clonorchis sinensis]
MSATDYDVAQFTLAGKLSQTEVPSRLSAPHVIHFGGATESVSRVIFSPAVVMLNASESLADNRGILMISAYRLWFPETDVILRLLLILQVFNLYTPDIVDAHDLSDLIIHYYTRESYPNAHKLGTNVLFEFPLSGFAILVTTTLLKGFNIHLNYDDAIAFLISGPLEIKGFIIDFSASAVEFGNSKDQEVFQQGCVIDPRIETEVFWYTDYCRATDELDDFQIANLAESNRSPSTYRDSFWLIVFVREPGVPPQTLQTLEQFSTLFTSVPVLVLMQLFDVFPKTRTSSKLLKILRRIFNNLMSSALRMYMYCDISNIVATGTSGNYTPLILFVGSRKSRWYKRKRRHSEHVGQSAVVCINFVTNSMKNYEQPERRSVAKILVDELPVNRRLTGEELGTCRALLKHGTPSCEVRPFSADEFDQVFATQDICNYRQKCRPLLLRLVWRFLGLISSEQSPGFAQPYVPHASKLYELTEIRKRICFAGDPAESLVYDDFGSETQVLRLPEEPQEEKIGHGCPATFSNLMSSVLRPGTVCRVREDDGELYPVKTFVMGCTHRLTGDVAGCDVVQGFVNLSPNVIDCMLADAGSDCMIPQGGYHVTQRRHMENNTVLAVPVYVVCGDEASRAPHTYGRSIANLLTRGNSLSLCLGVKVKFSVRAQIIRPQLEESDRPNQHGSVEIRFLKLCIGSPCAAVLHAVRRDTWLYQCSLNPACSRSGVRRYLATVNVTLRKSFLHGFRSNMYQWSYLVMGISARVSSKSATSAMTPYEPSTSTPRMSGWTDHNAILEFFARPAPTPRPAAVSQTAKCTPAIRPQKGYKEFKFYHYADPDAYIVQYRYDCSSVASRRCDDGPLEQFVVLNYKGEPISKSYEPSTSTPRMSGWTDHNAILEFFARPAPTPRPAAVSQTAKCTPAIRPQKGYKEFKFYHYADPDAYIVQYRYDCSSVASRRCDDGPLEQFVVLNYKGEPISKSNAPGGAIRNNPDAPKSCSPWASFDNGSCVTPRTSLLNLLEPGGGEAATFLNSCPLLKGATKQPPVKKSDERLIQRPQVLNSTRSGRKTAGRVPEQQVALQVNSQFSKSVRQLNQLTSAKCAIVPAPSKRGRYVMYCGVLYQRGAIYSDYASR